MLWRALGEVARGFWIDAGAADPDQLSVTRAFSEHGWHGINVEPTPAAIARLQAVRPNDINVAAALGAAPGRLVFYECGDPTLSTFDPAISARNLAAGRPVTEREVEVTTLAELCRQHAPADIHFLKVDVEGVEEQVLAGADFTRYRPWILVVEATWPMTRIPSHAGWEPGLLAADYRFAWFDGVNRFYIAAEHWDALARHFELPPNVFDEFVLFDPTRMASAAELADLHARTLAFDAELAQTRAALQAREAALATAHEQLQQGDALLAAVRLDLAAARGRLEVAAEPVGRADPLHRLARRLRRFMLVGQQAELGGLRLEIQRLASEINALRRETQLRP